MTLRHTVRVLKSLVSKLIAALFGVIGMAGAATPTYRADKLLIPEYQLDLPFAAAVPFAYSKTAISKPVYQTQDVAIDPGRNIWLTSNGRGGPGRPGMFSPDGTQIGQFRGGISIFETGSNDVLATLVIDESMYASGASAAYPFSGPVKIPYVSSTGFLYHGMDLAGMPKSVCPSRPAGAPAFVQTVFLPIVLPPNSALRPNVPGAYPDPLGRKDYDGHTLRIVASDAQGRPIYSGHDATGRPAVMAPMGAECHSRHPQAIAIDKKRELVYLLVEHSGLRWNADRTDFVPAASTAEESGAAVVLDIREYHASAAELGKKKAARGFNLKIVTGYLFGHAAHALAVNDNSGLVYQANRENSPGVSPPNWTDVINPANANPYGFIDMGYYQSLQDIEVNEGNNTVYGVSRIGQRMYAFDGSCVPKPNSGANLTVDRRLGWNCVKYWVDLRTPWDASYGSVSTQIFSTLDVAMPAGCLASVLDFGGLAVDQVNKRVYNGLHGIHHAEHTGLPTEGACTDTLPNGRGELEPMQRYSGRSIVEVNVNPDQMTIDPVTKQATAGTDVIDISNGYGYLSFANVEDVLGHPGTLADSIKAVSNLENSFVQGDGLRVDPSRHILLVTGGRTGNLGVVDTRTNRLVQVLPTSVFNPDLVNSPSSDCGVGKDDVPDYLEPHAHGVRLDPQTGKLYISDQGKHCFYESVTIITP